MRVLIIATIRSGISCCIARALLLCALLAYPLAPDPAVAQQLGPAPLDAGGRFRNWAPVGRGTLPVRLPFFARRVAARFHDQVGAAARVPNDGAFLRENALHSIPTLTWVGHSTFLVQMDHVSFLTDPIWSESASPFPWAGPRRHIEPGIALEHLPKLDFVVISHNHYDHLDLPTLEALAERSPEARFIVPLGNGQLLRNSGIENVLELDWGESIRIADVEVHILPAQHWSRRGLLDEQRSLWASWAVRGPQRRFYFAGDTGYFSGFAQIGQVLGPFDLAALPIGAYEPAAMMRDVHMNPEEAVQAGIDLRARRTVGMHFGTFALTDEPLDEPPRRFRAAGLAEGLPEDAIWVLKVGEMREF